MGSRRLAVADLITGLILAVAGAAILVLSIDMPRFEERGVNPWTVPGIMPGAIGAVLTILSLILVIRSLRRLSANTDEPHDISAEPTPIQSHRPTGAVAVTLGLLIAGSYALLVGRAPFALLTFLFLALFMFTFEFRQLRRDAKPWRRIALILAISASLAIIVPYVFETLFLVRLP